jgi:hypothetical protein
MARSKSKHIRLKNRRRAQHNQRMKRRKADAATQGTAAPARRPARKAPAAAPAPSAAPPAAAPSTPPPAAPPSAGGEPTT